MGRHRMKVFRDRLLVSEATTSFISMGNLGRKYNISRQRVHQILKRTGTCETRQHIYPSHGYQKKCSVCEKILAFSGKYCTLAEIAREVGYVPSTVCSHIKHLKSKGYLPRWFPLFRSSRLVLALRALRENDFKNIKGVGRQFGFVNLNSTICRLRKLGIPFNYLK